jgi:hypothetical protein
MSEEIVFTLRLTSDDWDPHLRAWRCPALDIPSAFVKEVRDAKGQPIAMSLLKMDKGPARLTWSGSGQPSQIAVVAGLGEELSPTSEEHFWKRLAIVVPIITAIIGGVATYVSKSGPDPALHTLRLRVDPNDSEASGLPPARITVNNREVAQPVEYKVVSDVMAIVDVSRAFDLAKTLGAAYRDQSGVVASSLNSLDIIFKQLDDLNSAVNGDICSGGGNGQPSPVRSGLSARATDISLKLRGVRTDLQGTLGNGGGLPK